MRESPNVAMPTPTPPQGARLRVLYLIGSLAIGGAERRCVRLLSALDRDHFDPTVGVFVAGGALEAEIRALDVPLAVFPRRGRFDISPVRALRRYLRAHPPDVVHAFDWLSTAIATIAARSIPTVAVVGSTIGMVYDVSRAATLRLALDRVLWRRLDAMVGNSETLRRYLLSRGFPEERLFIVPNGVAIPSANRLGGGERSQARRALGLPDDVPLVGTVGRLVPVKDQACLVRATRIVKERIANVRVAIVGEGSERASLVRLRSELRLDDNVLLAGETPSSDLVLPGFDVFVLSSRSEGMPNALLEASAWSLPLISTPVGGAVEIVKDGVTGMLVPIGDEDALAHSICVLLSDPEYAQGLGAAARDWVSARFSLASMARRFEHIYTIAVASRLRRNVIESAVRTSM